MPRSLICCVLRGGPLNKPLSESTAKTLLQRVKLVAKKEEEKRRPWKRGKCRVRRLVRGSKERSETQKRERTLDIARARSRVYLIFIAGDNARQKDTSTWPDKRTAEKYLESFSRASFSPISILFFASSGKPRGPPGRLTENKTSRNDFSSTNGIVRVLRSSAQAQNRYRFPLNVLRCETVARKRSLETAYRLWNRPKIRCLIDGKHYPINYTMDQRATN